MGPLNEMQKLFYNSDSEVSDYFVFELSGIKYGLVFLIVVVVLEHLFWYSVTSMHEYYIIMNSGETAEAKEAEEDRVDAESSLEPDPSENPGKG